jgi:hypothetical protein
MTALTARDKWLAAGLPALMTLLLGWLVFLRPASREASLLRQRVQNQGSLSARRTQVNAVLAENATLEKSLAELEDPNDSPVETVFDRNWSLQYLSLFSARHGLSLDKTSLETAARLPPALQQAIPLLTNPPKAQQPQIWRLEFTGYYPAMVKLLEDLKDVKPLMVPLNISMEPAKNERLPAKWVLTIWL